MWWAAAAQYANAGFNLYSGLQSVGMQRLELAETLRRMRKQYAARRGEAVAAGAASGIEFESRSVQDYLAGMDAEFRREADFLARTGKAKADMAEQAAWWKWAGDFGSSMGSMFGGFGGGSGA